MVVTILVELGVANDLGHLSKRYPTVYQPAAMPDKANLSQLFTPRYPTPVLKRQVRLFQNTHRASSAPFGSPLHWPCSRHPVFGRAY